MKNIAITLLLAALIAGGVWWWNTAREPAPSGAAAGPPAFGGGQRPPTVVVVEAVGYRTFVDAIEAVGTTQANESVTLTAKVADTVRNVNFEDGQLVEAGHVLIEQTNREESALLAEARANLNDAETQLRRVLDLGQRGLAPASEVDLAQSRADAARARLNAIVARMDDRLIRAPFAGVLGLRQVSPGTLVTPGTAIATLDDISTIKLDFAIPEVFLSEVAPGNPVVAHSAAYRDREFAGRVASIDSRIDPVTRSVTVRALLPNQDRLLRPGMLMTVQLVSREESSLAVSELAVQQVRNEHYVFVVEDGRAVQRRILAGRRRPGSIEVLEGLAEGERVITEGLIKIRDGAPVQVQGDAIAERGAPPPAKAPRVGPANEGS